MYRISKVNITEFLNKKYFEMQMKKGGRINVDEFAALFGAKQSLVSMWLNGSRNPGPKYKKLIIEMYGDEAIVAFGEDPDLYAVTQNWDYLSPEERRSHREQVEQQASKKNETKRTYKNRRTSTL
jgi:hypothetical protein